MSAMYITYIFYKFVYDIYIHVTQSRSDLTVKRIVIQIKNIQEKNLKNIYIQTRIYYLVLFTKLKNLIFNLAEFAHLLITVHYLKIIKLKI